ncbi:hypothetical protein A2933_01785 [Candidatus Nomurabacteria bacterium RIFCSPLOWO2_01_FULL_46_18]|uniref:Uncharacterized protein n=1 Tax=Candidatus Nomurabacteria bacterium RIFCSPLOWO2_01_FULL_46_18 TaxID=1801783 RepID=A0A1F6XCK9_9BACT|nr:MAG: hypothetical protein A2933_01785 [Candidatus Nomurabacteria bacterium RIFCSPLOWO2_01_FULL_46_18]
MNVDNNFAESMLKGRMAETLFEELLKESGNIVYRFGYEALVQNLVQLEKSFDRYGEVGEKIRAIPDFIVIDKSGRPDFVEVKFRWKPELHESDKRRFDQVAKYWGAKMVLVNCWEQPYFRISEPPYFKNDKLILKPMSEFSAWGINKETYLNYEGLVHKYLTPTLIPKRK